MPVTPFSCLDTVLVIFVCGLTAANAHGHLNDNWNQLVLFDDAANLTCVDEHYGPAEHPDARYHWLLPSGSILDAAGVMYDDHYTLLHNDSNLLIHEVNWPDFGVYYCLVLVGPQYESVYTAIKRGVNADGPYYGDMEEKYMPRLRIGLVAGGVIFVFMSMLCFNLNQFQAWYDKPPGALPSNSVSISQQTHQSSSKEMVFNNTAFAEDGQDDDRGEDEPTKL